MFGLALRYRRKGFQEASDALEAAVGCCRQLHEVVHTLQHGPPLWTYMHPGEAKDTVVLVHLAADQYPASGPIVGRSQARIMAPPQQAWPLGPGHSSGIRTLPVGRSRTSV